MSGTCYVHRVRREDGKEGWTRVAAGERQAAREAAAWEGCGWAATIHPTSPEVRQRVKEWERQARRPAR